MKNNRITMKLFILTAVFFIVFISITLLFQTMFFQKFYINKKIENFTRASQKLSVDYKKANMQDDRMISLIGIFDEKYNSKTAIFYLARYMDGVKDSINIKTSESLFFPVDKNTATTMIPIVLKEWLIRPELYNPVVVDMKPFMYKSDFLNVSNMVNATPVILHGKVDRIIFSIATLQPVGEAVLALNEFYIYISAIILIILLALIFSIMISKPLLNLKKMALKISSLDFTEECKVKSKDELGDLARILNFLSRELDKTMVELKSANEKLKEEIENEKKLDKMRKEFIAGVSHELKTPISLISGYAEAVKDKVVKPPDQERFMEVILDESRKMGCLVKDMLDLSQLESAGYKLNKEIFDLVELTNAAFRKFAYIVETKNIFVERNFSCEKVLICGDIFRFEQVITNFVSNAIKHTPDHAQIMVTIYHREDAVVFELENQGSPIPVSELGRVWEKFYKVDKSRNRELEGTGIGLAIVKNILQLHECNFGVENTQNGVKFYFSIRKEN